MRIKRFSAFLAAICILGTVSLTACSGGAEETPTTTTTTTSVTSSSSTENTTNSDTEIVVTTVPTESESETETFTETAASITETSSEETTVTEENEGGFNASTEATTAETTTAPPETKITETEAAQAPQVTPPETPIGAPITNKYAYNTLSSREQGLYDMILTAMQNCQTVVDYEGAGYTEADWNKIFCNVYYQEAQVFWVNPFIEPGEIQYKTTDFDEINAMQASIDNMTQQIVNNASTLTNNVDRVKYIHDCIIQMNNFEKSGGTNYSPTIYGGLVLGNLQCEGYAKTFAYVCNKAGIETIVVTGNVESGASHAWNKVCVDGTWYNIDLTHDDPVLQTPNSEYIRYNYFLVPDSWIEGISHFRTNLSQLYSGEELYKAPSATSADYSYFNYYDKVYTDYESAYNELLNRVINTANNRKPLAQIKLSNRAAFDMLMNNLVNLKDEAKAATGSPWTRIAVAKDENLYIISISLEY